MPEAVDPDESPVRHANPSFSPDISFVFIVRRRGSAHGALGMPAAACRAGRAGWLVAAGGAGRVHGGAAGGAAELMSRYYATQPEPNYALKK